MICMYCAWSKWENQKSSSMRGHRRQDPYSLISKETQPFLPQWIIRTLPTMSAERSIQVFKLRQTYKLPWEIRALFTVIASLLSPPLCRILPSWICLKCYSLITLYFSSKQMAWKGIYPRGGRNINPHLPFPKRDSAHKEREVWK